MKSWGSDLFFNANDDEKRNIERTFDTNLHLNKTNINDDNLKEVTMWTKDE